MLQYLLCPLKRRPHRHGYQVFSGHPFRNRDIKIGLEAEISVCQNPYQLAVCLGNRHSGNTVLRHHLQGIPDFLIGTHGDRIDDHS